MNINRAGFDYQGNYVERTWAETTIGYEFEDENGSVNDPTFRSWWPRPAFERSCLRATGADPRAA